MGVPKWLKMVFAALLGFWGIKLYPRVCTVFGFCLISLGTSHGPIVTCNNDGIRLDFTEIFKKVRKALMLST
jgi:hypothetical protein